MLGIGVAVIVAGWPDCWPLGKIRILASGQLADCHAGRVRASAVGTDGTWPGRRAIVPPASRGTGGGEQGAWSGEPEASSTGRGPERKSPELADPARGLAPELQADRGEPERTGRNAALRRD